MMFSNLSGQNTKLLYHKKSLFSKAKYINIFFSNSKGSNFVKPEDIASSDYLYFCYKPVGEWTFKENEIYEDKELKGINIKQNGESIFNSRLNPIIENSNIIMVIASFQKDKISIIQPIEFYNDLDISQPIQIPEKYWPNYKTYSQYYTEGAKQFDEKKYLKSFEFLKHFITEDKEITGFSFYNNSRKLIKNTIKDFIDDSESDYKKLNLEIKKQSINESKIAKLESLITKLESLYNSIIKAQQMFSLYFSNIADNESKEWQKELNELVSNMVKSISETREIFKIQKLSLFEMGDYNEDKFKLYVDLLVGIICYKDFIDKITGLDTLDITIIDKFSSKKDVLVKFELIDDLESILRLINDNITDTNYVINSKAIKHLEGLKNTEREPYFDIFMAFNSLVDKKLDIFAKYINQSLNKCTDEQLLSFLEVWNLSYMATKQSIDERALNSLKEGIIHENNRDFVSADEQYKKAKIYAPYFAPPLFYLGKLNYKNNKKFTADSYFSKALEIYPEYIEPRKYKIKFLIENFQYSDALEEVNLALTYCPFWYFYYQKANILYFLNDYSESMNILINECIKQNANNFDQYILLGDIYFNLDDKDNAEKFYRQAGIIEPENPIFSKKMEKIYTNNMEE